MIRVVLLRHAPAAPRSAAVPDELRPLTREGAEKMRAAARGLSRVLEEARVVTSPALRARETARVVAEALGTPPPDEALALAADAPGPLDLLAWGREGETTVLVGHEPHLSAAIAHALGAPRADAFALKKGGAALLELDPREGGPRLVWLAPPRLLRALGA